MPSNKVYVNVTYHKTVWYHLFKATAKILLWMKNRRMVKLNVNGSIRYITFKNMTLAKQDK